MLPGVKEEHLRKTNIARTLRAIEKCSHVGHLELVYGDLAHWIIQKWAKTAMNRSLHRSARDLLLEQQAQIKRAGTDGQVHLAEQATRKATAQQKETARLEALRTSSPKVDETPQDPGDDVVVYLPQFNSLGSETLRRPVRQTQELESLAAKINREYEDSVRKHHKDEDEENLDGIPVGRIVFGKPQLMHFSQHAMVMDLFATTRSKLMDKGPGSDKGATGEHEASACAPPSLPLPNKTQAPKKSILKVRDQVLVPASQVTW
ncbi:hypothetical protein PsorP6_011279 [Peronosclerospora sorghi]|uniref:Uncharacterized protein n=1 Tax=Peronosclerospora sorghi TaxID=230839 RepID=A0ACC0WKM2_9STRA|nr:hypothetical protein PsorP6_011279 [Peronosclerospora sorghi]